MSKELKPRSEIDLSLTWDLSHIFKTNEEYEKTLTEIVEKSKEMESKYKDKLIDPNTILECIEEYEDVIIKGYLTNTYSYLAMAVDQTNSDNQTRAMKNDMILSEVISRLTFIESELKEKEDNILDQAINKTEKYKIYLEDIKRSKPHTLHPEVEKAIASLSPVLQSPENVYSQAKLADMDFGSFEAKGEEHPLSFVLFENTYQGEKDTEIRRRAFDAFSNKIKEYQNTIAIAYQTQVQKEKIISTMRKFDSVFDYLLFDQKVDRELYNRQIDVIMEKLAPHMRKYAKLIKRIYGLDEMTFADLKVSIDPEYDPKVTIEESKKYIKGALSVMGKEYLDLVMRAYDERWVDFAQNIGKSTGGFCATPYGVHAYILLSWNGLMSEVFTLVHELGHAGHFMLSQKHNNLFNESPSLYFIEAPSTINEMLLSNYLIKQQDDPRFKRWVLSSMVSNTYYHNFVTHLLEAAYQREVYKIIDEGGSVHANKLSEIKKDVLEKFWGDAVTINSGAELTWIRQPHYYMGLYPYTYSAGLTVATQVSQRILNGDESAIDDWKEVLKAGGTKTPVELAKMAGVDITTDKPLLETIEYIGSLIDEIIKLTDEIERG
ncbi:oligoendopeptidase F [Proteiniborus ethanoligenes]|uniref:Oligopeptidase F n=1 Tax=Proteiniborus ethanoligenes TaxID=415015 RepID=A0A1H3JSP6_9FIRM|nr:oligoendopeptidase F [Proteiniborus ethanoligenes]TAH62208.1 MAG: oligoendopeptidase F [Gottschalkiaceae bacterium]SDY42952.1 oligoendopeptidase F [Proteiniborus ethanoligenes]